MIHRLVAIALLICFAPSPAVAQTSATLVGVVQDAQGGRLPGVSVRIRQTETGVARDVVTDSEGRFNAAALSAGEYELRASLDGFRPLVQTGLRLTVGESAAVTLTLQVGTAEEVTVRGTSGVNTQTGELSYLTDQRTIEQIPVNGRNYTDLMQLLPTVNAFPHRDNGSVVAHGLAMSVNGQNPRTNVYLLDGTLQNDFTNSPASSAAGTALGMETIREFRLASNSYSAEYGRAAGGQINVITKSGTNQLAGTGFLFHRNDALDARNYFDVDEKPDFRRYQTGGTLGGPLRADHLFFFGGYEGLFENLGRTIVTTVPDDNARRGVLPTGTVPISPNALPYLLEFPVANGPSLGGGLAQHRFGFDQRLRQNFVQGRVDAVPSPGSQFFVRYTLDDAEQDLPTDYPQFPRAFVSTNQFLTAEYRTALSPATFATARFGFSRTHIAQTVESNTTQAVTPFVPGRPTMGAIDIGGLPRFGPQLSADLVLGQDVFSGQFDVTHARGHHLLKAGGLVERYSASEFNPTFSRGVYRFASLQTFLAGTAASFIGLTPEGDLNRALGLDAGRRLRPGRLGGAARSHDQRRPAPRGGDHAGRSARRQHAGSAGAGADDRAALPESRRDVLAADRRRVERRRQRSHVRPRRLRPLLHAQQPAGPDRHRHQPAGDAARGHRIAVVPGAAVRAGRRHLGAADPGRHRVSAHAHVERERAAAARRRLGGQHRLRGRARPAPVAQRRRQRAGAGDPRRRHAVLRRRARPPEPGVLRHRAEGQRRRLLVQGPDPRGAAAVDARAAGADVVHVVEGRGHDAERHVLLGLDDRLGVGDAGSDPRLQQGPVGLPRRAQLGAERDLAGADPARSGERRRRPAERLADRDDRPDAQRQPADRVRPDQPIALAVGAVARARHRPRSPQLRARTRPRGRRHRRSRPLVRSDGVRAAADRHVRQRRPQRPDRPRPAARSTWRSRRSCRGRRSGAGGRVELRVEIFNLFNRVNFGPPSLVAFSGTGTETAPLASFGQIRTTITSARQMQLGVRVVF